MFALCIHTCVHKSVGVCVLFVCVRLLVYVAEARHDPCSLGNKPFEMRDLVPYVQYRS